ncbi:hypothetical protein ASE38_01555 [Cellulomonas sp. Root930]|nr:hypothetical protein ASE38_01555 [Cellulomonas sp. Root930]
MARARKATAASVGSVDDIASATRRLQAAGYGTDPERVAQVRKTLDAYRPRGRNPEEQLRALEHVRPLLEVAPLTDAALVNLMRLVPNVAVPALRLRRPMSAADLVGVAAVDDFLAQSGRVYGPRTQSRIRSAAGQLGRALGLPDYPPKARAYPRSARRTPYRTGDIQAYLALADRMPAVHREDALTLIHLADNGLTAAEIAAARGTDVVVAGHPFISVPGAAYTRRLLNARSAPFLIARALHIGGGHLLRPGRDRNAATEAIVGMLASHGRQLDRFRVRSAVDGWRLRLLEASDLAAFFRIVDLQVDSHSYADLFEHVLDATDQQCHDLLARLTATPGRTLGVSDGHP